MFAYSVCSTVYCGSPALPSQIPGVRDLDLEIMEIRIFKYNMHMGGIRENTLSQYMLLVVKYNTIIHFLNIYYVQSLEVKYNTITHYLNTYCLHSLFKGADR